MSLASSEVLVSGPEPRNAKLAVRIIAPIVAMLGAWLALGIKLPWAGIPLIVAAVLTLIVNEVLAVRRLRGRRWVVDAGTGFRFLGGPDEVMVVDSQVRSLRLVHERAFSGGVLKHVDRRFEVYADGRPTPIVMKSRLVAGETDALAELINRIVENLTTRTAEALAAGASLESDEWTLTRAELVVREGRIARAVPFAGIDHVGVFDGKLCLWCKGQEAPVARVKLHSLNAPILGRLLDEWVKDKAEAGASADEEPAGGSGLGRILFERRSRAAMWVLVTLAIILGIVGAGFCAGPNTWLWGLLFLAIVPLALVGAWYNNEAVFRCHARGIYQKRGRREKRMSYVDIEVFNYHATRMFVNGVYNGTQLAISFKSAQTTISYSASIKNADDDLDELRDHIAKVVAGRMVRQIEEGQRVSWAGDMTLSQQGVEFRRSGFLGSKPPESLTYAQIRGWNINEGFFFLWSEAEPKPVLSKSVSAANFFPGFYAFLSLWETAKAGTEATHPASTEAQT